MWRGAPVLAIGIIGVIVILIWSCCRCCGKCKMQERRTADCRQAVTGALVLVCVFGALILIIVGLDADSQQSETVKSIPSTIDNLVALTDDLGEQPELWWSGQQT